MDSIGNIAQHGGALYGMNNVTVTIVSSNFYGKLSDRTLRFYLLFDASARILRFVGNKAFKDGGSIMVWGHNYVSIMNTMLEGNLLVLRLSIVCYDNLTTGNE